MMERHIGLGKRTQLRKWPQEKLQAAVEKKKICNMKAQKIVETLIDNKVEPEVLLSQLQYINRCHYEDITVERGIGKICGYPLCDNKLHNIPKKKYHISTVENRVYDLTDRKNFCSNQCYKFSEYIKNQLLTTPLWMRDIESLPKFALLTDNNKISSISNDIIVGKKEDENIEQNLVLSNENGDLDSFMNILDDEIGRIDKLLGKHKSEQNSVKIKHETRIGSNMEQPPSNKRTNQFDSDSQLETTTFPIISDSKPTDTNENKYIACPTDNKKSINEVHSSDNLKHDKCNENTVEVTDDMDPIKRSVLRIENSLKEWFTIDSLRYILSEEIVKNLMKEKAIKVNNNRSSMDDNMLNKYADMCRKLNLLELQDEEFDCLTNSYNLPSKPAPDYAALQKEAKNIEINVKSFYDADFKYYLNEDSSESQIEDSLVMPLVHQHDQKALRRKIVLDQLKNALPDIVSVLGIGPTSIMGRLKHLIHTFCLSRHNITFKPPEWRLITIILLKMLSKNDEIIEQHLTSKYGNKYLMLSLMKFRLESNYLDLLCAVIMDVDSILKHQDSLS